MSKKKKDVKDRKKTKDKKKHKKTKDKKNDSIVNDLVDSATSSATVTNESIDTISTTVASTAITNASSWSEAFSQAASVVPIDLGDDFVIDDPPPPSNASPYEQQQQQPSKVPYGSGNIMAISQIAMQCLGKVLATKEDVEDDAMTTSTNVQDEKKISKKRKLESIPEIRHINDEVLVENPKVDDHETIKKKKKDKKKKKSKKESTTKKDPIPHSDENDSTSNINEDENQLELEGKMIVHQEEHIMVLIDNTKKIVYSGLERTEDGELIPIGVLHDDTNEVKITKGSHESTKIDEDSNEAFPFQVDEDDHCESPFIAYQDLDPILSKLDEIYKKPKGHLQIYDPYYCNGSVMEHLNQLGYSNVYNKKEDCYLTWSSKTTSEDNAQPYPDYDVFITNPPYSSDHIEKLMKHLFTDKRTKDKPWCLLMPTFVHKKDYYKDGIASSKKKQVDDAKGRTVPPFYLVPKKRYVYVPPKNFREKKDSDVHKKSSPFVSMWYVWGGSQSNTDLLVKAYNDYQRKGGECRCDLARGKSALRDLRRK